MPNVSFLLFRTFSTVESIVRRIVDRFVHSSVKRIDLLVNDGGAVQTRAAASTALIIKSLTNYCNHSADGYSLLEHFNFFFLLVGFIPKSSNVVA